MVHQNNNKVIRKKSSTLTKVERNGKVTIYENNQPVAEISEATGTPLHEEETSHIIIKRKNRSR